MNGNKFRIVIQWSTGVKTKEKSSRQKKNSRGKTKMLAEKKETDHGKKKSRQNKNARDKKEIGHDKREISNAKKKKNVCGKM